MSCTTANISVFHVSPSRLFHLRLPSDSEEGAVHSNERNSAFGENDSVRWKWDLLIAFKDRKLESVQVHSEWIHVSQANQRLGVNKQSNLLSV